METQTAVATVEHSAPETYQLIALDRPQLEQAHGKMLEFVKSRLLSVAVELNDEREALAIAKENGWGIKAHNANVKRLEKRVQFFEKIQLAVEAGYVILPNLAMEVFAIRTAAKTPRGQPTDRSWERFTQPAQLLPVGMGRYVAPEPDLLTQTVQVPDGKGGTKSLKQYWPDDFTDVDFPMVMAKPALMNAAGMAMARGIFDELGVAIDGGGRKPDPVLMGRIKNPGRGADISFYLGWYFDPTVL